MAANYYSIDKAAEVLGVTTDEVKEMRERRELYGYRDGATWKFKAEDVDRLATERQGGGEEPTGDESDVLLSDLELGHSASSSGTVIGMDADLQGLSDIKLSVSQPTSEVKPAAKPSEKTRSTPVDETAAFDSDDLQLGEEELPMGSSKVTGDKPAGGTPVGGKAAAKQSDSDIDLAGDDDSLVLGGSGSGSDVAIGADSGISLVDPADSGLSLEQPLELGGGAEESLELEEDDMLSLAEEPGAPAGASSASGPKLGGGGDDDFLLTPMSEGGDEEDSESGSQVIALDTEGSGEEAAGAPMALLDEEPGGAGLAAASHGAGVSSAAVASMAPGVMPASAIEGMPMMAPAAALPEAPWGAGSIVGLAVCFVLLVIGGLLAFDVARNVGQYSGASSASSVLMDSVVGLFEK